MAARRTTTTERGLGAAHQAMRRRLIPTALGTPCPGPWTGPRSKHCTGLMTDPRRMDLDDRVPRVFGGSTTTTGGRICCTPCNRGHGARLGNRLRAHTRRAAVLPRW
jgi:hypothetical protein